LNKWITINELKRIWKEAAVAQFRVLSQHLSGGTEEIHKNKGENTQKTFSQDSQCTE
jgi:hypothetical protein